MYFCWLYTKNNFKNDINWLSYILKTTLKWCKLSILKKHIIWSNNSLTCEVMKESNKWKRVACSNYLLKNSKKNMWKAHLETSSSSNLQFLNIVPLLCSGIETTIYTFSNNFQTEEQTAQQRGHWGRKSGERSQLLYTLKTCNNSKKFCKPSSNIERGCCWKVMQASLKPPSFSM